MALTSRGYKMAKQLLTPEVRKRMHEDLDKILDSDLKGISLLAVGVSENGMASQLSLIEGRFTGKELVAAMFTGVEDAFKMTDIPEARTAAKALRQLLSELITAFHLGDAVRKGMAPKPTENVTWH